MSRYLVKDKYTYERKPQTDYTFGSWPYSYVDSRVQSHNHIHPMFVTEPVRTLGTFTFSADAPVEVPVDAQTAAALSASSAVSVSVAAGDAHYRVTFFGADGQSFCSVGTAREGQSDDFALVRISFAPVSMRLDTDGGAVTASLSLSCVWNTLGEWGGQAHFYTAEGASLSDVGGGMALTVSGKGGFISRDLPRGQGSPYSMLMPRRNTLFFILRNPDGLASATVSFTSTASPAWSADNAVTLPLVKDAEPRAYFFNLSRCPGCDGRLTAFRFEVKGEGTLYVDGYSFEQEKPLDRPAAVVTSCTADKDELTLTVTGTLTGTGDADLAPYAGGRLSLYAGTMADDQGLGLARERTAGKTYIGSAPLPASGDFALSGLPLMLGPTTLLPYQLLLFAECDGLEPVCLCGRFYIDNYREFTVNPYAFTLPDYTVSVLDCGAKGDAVHNDTDAIQSAIDRVNAAGGGVVDIPGSDDFYGKRYVVTSLLMRDNVELRLGHGAILWQSQRAADYPYEPAYGHDGVIPGINWTHSLHVSNLPLIQGANLSHIRIVGAPDGTSALRMLDTASEEGVGMPGYAAGCPRRIHCIPLGLFCCDYVETADFDILRSNNYHTEYNHCTHVHVANVKLHEVKCVSGDGFGMAGGKHILVDRCFMQSNDDGVVMSCHMYDPRGILWWTNMVGEDNGCRDITTVHSYINSGGGKALAFITWGTSDPIQEREEISEVVAYDNYLTSVNPVGTWPDNPYAGKQPFDNSETDDYSPVKNVRIFHNVYAGNCTLGPIACTNVLTDCGVKSTSDFRNGDFSLGGMANWTMWKNAAPDSVQSVIWADKEKGRISRFDCGEAAAAQGLHLEAGRHTFTCELLTGESGAELFVCRIPDVTSADPAARGAELASAPFVCPTPTLVSLTFELDDDEADLFIGIRSRAGDTSADGYAVFDACRMTSEIDRAAIEARKIRRFTEALSRDFVLTPDFDAQPENGKVYLHTGTMNGRRDLAVKGERTTFALSCAVRANDYNYANGHNGFGYRFAVRDGGRSFRELCFNVSACTLTVTDVVNGEETVLWTRPNFFFTSTDFHIFKLEVTHGGTVVWVDGSQYTSLPLTPVTGGVSLFFRDMDASVCNLVIE